MNWVLPGFDSPGWAPFCDAVRAKHCTSIPHHLNCTYVVMYLYLLERVNSTGINFHPIDTDRKHLCPSMPSSDGASTRLYLLDYGAGNVRSLANSLTALGHNFEWVNTPDDFHKADVRVQARCICNSVQLSLTKRVADA